MTERVSRLIYGFSLIISLFLEWDLGVYAIIFILIFEGTTNLRLPILLRKLCYSLGCTKIDTSIDYDENENHKYHYEAERLFRFSVAFFISLGFMLFDGYLWILPWFVSLNLLLAGTSGICPLVMLFRRIGFR